MAYEVDQINIPNDETAAAMLDKLTRVGEERRSKPLSYYVGPIYPHRSASVSCGNYTLKIGDTVFYTPPEFINISSESLTQQVITLRQENSTKSKPGFHKRMILIDLVFNGNDQINGYKVNGPDKIYYVDGLRQLLAQFKYTPFLPIRNHLINGTYGIFTVALQTITIQTVKGFPNVLKANIILQEIDMFPYLEMPSIYFKDMIDWDLFRYYYQRCLTEKNEYKKLKSMPVNQDNNYFRISILNKAVFSSAKAKEYSLLELLCDKAIVNEDADSNYDLRFDSKEYEAYITDFQCSYSNILTNLQLSDCGTPTVQFLGGMDTIYNITFQTRNEEAIQAIELCRVYNDSLTRNNALFYSAGFVKLESPMVAFTGSLFVMIDAVNVNTVPGFPDLYNVQVQFISYDIGQSKREEINGFKPFDCSGCGYYDNKTGTFVSNHLHAIPNSGDKNIPVESVQTIEQSIDGLYTKINQDCYAEWKLRNTFEVYPDLWLPTYEEVNLFITQCINFRKHFNLKPLKYTRYPVRPECMVQGINPNNNVTVRETSTHIVDPSAVAKDAFPYTGYMDPDFYVFYPNTYDELYHSNADIDIGTNTQAKAYTETVKQAKTPVEYIEEFVQFANDAYCSPVSTKASYDASINQYTYTPITFIAHGLNKLGLITFTNLSKLTDETAITKINNICTQHSVYEVQPGDIIVCYAGSGNIVQKIGISNADVVIYADTKTKQVTTTYYGDFLQGYQDSCCVLRPNLFHGEGEVSITSPTPGTLSAEHSNNQKIRATQNTIETTTTTVSIETVQNNTSTQAYKKNATGNVGIIITNLRAAGLTEIAIGGILGNLDAESGCRPDNLQNTGSSELGLSDAQYTAKVNTGSMVYDSSKMASNMSKAGLTSKTPKTCFICDGFGYGIAQWTWYSRKASLWDRTIAKGKPIDDINVQCELIVAELGSSGIKALNNCTTVQAASNWFLHNFEKPANHDSSTIKSAGQSWQQYHEDSRGTKAQHYYDEYLGTSNIDLVPTTTQVQTTTTTTSTNTYVDVEVLEEMTETRKLQLQLTYEEIANIEQTIYGQVFGNKNEQDLALCMAQMIFDQIQSQTFTGLSYILTNATLFPCEARANVPANISQTIRSVFTSDVKKWPNSRVYCYLGPKSAINSVDYLKKQYDKLSYESSLFSFWGIENTPSNHAIYTFVNAETSTNSYDPLAEEKIYHHAVDNDILKYFAEPMFVKTEAIRYNTHTFTGQKDNKENRRNFSEILNKTVRQVGSSFVNEAQFSCRGRLVRAFPSYLLCILDDNTQWYDGRKLWTNFYTHKSVIDIQVHESNDTPVQTATIAISNIFHNLDKTQGGLSSYKREDDRTKWQNIFYNYTGIELDFFSPNLATTAIKLNQIIYQNFKLREGARVHLRMGYGSDPLSLPIAINGTVSDVSLGDQITAVIMSDGAELQNHVIASTHETNSNFNPQESSELIADVLCERAKGAFWSNLNKKWWESSKNGIEHFGLYFNQAMTLGVTLSAAAMGIGTGTTLGIVAGTAFAASKLGTAIGATIGSVIPGIGNIIAAGVGLVAGAIVGATVATITAFIASSNLSISDIWDGYSEQYDILKNIYLGNYRAESMLYPYVFNRDGELNIEFNQFNMTAWDISQVATQNTPEYIVKPTYHQFDTRLYYGLPFWMERYRYDILGKEDSDHVRIYEEVKASTQVHLLESLTNIIDNQIKCTGRYSDTNKKIVYTQGAGKEQKSTPIVHSDDTIYYSYQKTGVIDSPLVRNSWGPDAFYELFGARGKLTAERVGVSNLLYDWQIQYQGSIICTGLPGVYAHDYALIQDTVSNIAGLAVVREVIHSFNSNTGFTTSIVPGMVSACTDKKCTDGGMIQMYVNYLNIFNRLSSMLVLRKALKEAYDEYLPALCQFELIEMQLENISTVQNRDKILDTIGIVDTTTTVLCSAYYVTRLLNATQMVSGIVAGAKAAKAVITTTAGPFKGLGFAKVLLQGISTGAKAFKSVAKVPGPWFVFSLVIFGLIDNLITYITDFMRNRQRIVVIPLWWEGKPLISNARGQKHLILTSTESEIGD